MPPELIPEPGDATPPVRHYPQRFDLVIAGQSTGQRMQCPA
jgi:hypothetical protein